MTGRKTPRQSSTGGRPPLPPEERALRRISVRLYADDEVLLAELCEKLSVSEAEVIRRALALLGRTTLKR